MSEECFWTFFFEWSRVKTVKYQSAYFSIYTFLPSCWLFLSWFSIEAWLVCLDSVSEISPAARSETSRGTLSPFRSTSCLSAWSKLPRSVNNSAASDWKTFSTVATEFVLISSLLTTDRLRFGDDVTSRVWSWHFSHSVTNIIKHFCHNYLRKSISKRATVCEN